jgi:hypothetical protein
MQEKQRCQLFQTIPFKIPEILLLVTKFFKHGEQNSPAKMKMDFIAISVRKVLL